MKLLKSIEIALFLTWGITTIYLFSTTNTNPYPNIFGWSEVFITIIITFVSVSFFWYWMLIKMSRKIREYELLPVPQLGNNLFNSPLEFILLLAIFFLVGGISILVAILIGFGFISQIGLLSLAYGLGLIGTIKLIMRRQRKNTEKWK